MKRVFFGALALCLALGVGWFLVSLQEKPATSTVSDKPNPATANSSAAQMPTPATATSANSGVKPLIQQPKTSGPEPHPVTARVDNLPAGPSSKSTHKLHTPGDGMTPEIQEQLRSLIKQELSLEDSGDLQGAIAVNKKVVQIDPKSAISMNVIAGLYGKQGDFAAEIEWARKAIAADRLFSSAYINYGNALGSTGHPKEAKKAFQRAAVLDPQSPYGVYGLGVLAGQQHDYYTALWFYRKSVEIDPKFENGYYNTAAMCYQVHRYDEALAALNKVLQLNPKADDARALTQEIARIQAQPQPQIVKVAQTITRHKRHKLARHSDARQVRAPAKHHRHHSSRVRA